MMRYAKWDVVFFAAVLWMTLDGPVRAETFQIPLTVQESSGIARHLATVSGGLPLPKGRFKVSQPFALFRETGEELPCQVNPLVVEIDGTLRWILIDFQDDFAADATNRYVLRAVTPSGQLAVGLRIDEGPDRITIDTGKVQFTIAKNKPFGLFDSVSADGKPVVDGGEVSYVQLQGRDGWDDTSKWNAKRFTAGKPESVKTHYAGPFRVTVEIAGHFDGDPLRAGYKAWITAWAGQSRVAVKHKLCNSNPDRYTIIPVSRSTLELRLASAAKKVWLGANEPLAVNGDAWIQQGLFLHHTYQDIPAAAKAGSGDRTLWTAAGPKDKPAGWIAATGTHNIFICDRLFASNPARRLAVTGDRVVLEGIAERFEGPKDAMFKQDRRVGQPWLSDGFWLFDCSHHSSEYLFDFDFDFPPPVEADALDELATVARNRLWVLAPGQYYSDCDVLGTGPFGTLKQEKQCYEKWRWKFRPSQVPQRDHPLPDAFVAAEDNHYESEADSVQGLLLMYLRTGERGWFDLGEAWARYHMDLQAWRTDRWRWKDGSIWFPSGGPQGNRRVREDWNFAWGADWGDRKGNRDCTDLWRASKSKSCYCHYYGSGLADYFCLTGDPDALAAAIDNVEQKDDEFRHFKQYEPGKSAVGSIRGFGRGFEVMVRVLMADPDNQTIRDLCHLCAQTLWKSSLLDERGFHCSGIGGGQGGMAAKLISQPVKRWMDGQGIRFTTEGETVDTLTKGDRTWKVRAMGGTWQHVYMQNGADLYARYFDDEDMRDFTIAFAQMSARYMLSPKCHQTWYYTFFDVPDRGMVFDPWVYEHSDTKDGIGCVHSGWYTRFYPDACAKGFSLTGERHLIERAKEFWGYGSRRAYRTKEPKCGPREVGQFLGHTPPKDDTVLESSRLMHEVSHGRSDDQPPTAVTDLSVKPSGDGKAEIRFTAPADVGTGRVVRYQVKASELPIASYEQWDFARDDGKRRNWWRAVNCKGEPVPGKPGAKERFVVSGVPKGKAVHFAIRSFDDSSNRSAISNIATVNQER